MRAISNLFSFFLYTLYKRVLFKLNLVCVSKNYFKKKLLRCLNVNVQIETRITTTKLNLFTNTKDKVLKQNKSNAVYEFTCPKCNSSYIGKTDRTLLERVKEHAYKDQERAVNKHLNSCYDTNYLDSKTNNELTDFVMTNSKIIDSSNNWNLILYKEALHYTSKDANPY